MPELAAQEKDPITKVFDAFWVMLNSHQPFCNLVKAGNQITFMGKDAAPIKGEISDGDLPEVRILPTSAEVQIQRTSNSSTIIMTWEIGVSTGDQRIDCLLFPLTWEIYRALKDWRIELDALTWNSKKYVKLVRPLTVAFGVSQTDLNRGIKGWSGLWSGETQMWFDTSDL